MPDSSFNFGIQSYCFRTIKDNPTVAKNVRELGLNQIEVCGVHADFHNLSEWKNVVGIYQDAGVSIVSIGVQTFKGADNEKDWFECAALAGAKHISAHLQIQSYTAAIPRIRQWSREYGIRVGLHCHGGYQFGGSPDVLQHLIGLGGPEIGLCIDTAWCMQIGPRRGNPAQWVEDFSGKVYGLHLKDFTFDPNGQWHDTVVGEGTLDLKALHAALVKDKFDGMAVLEYEADPENPMPALHRCVAAMKQVLA
jgi:sugar phosphate isomerase/epimerase